MTKLTHEEFRNFFHYFEGNPGEPHQDDAVRMLYEQMPASLLEDDSAWVLRYRRPPLANPSNPIQGVPYFSQLDNASGEGYRECFSSSCAMVAAYYGKVNTDDEYNNVRERYGDTTDAQAHVHALRYLGLYANFVTNATVSDLERQIDVGRPTPCGWLHNGSVSYPSGGGHYSVVIGYTQDTWVQHDPNGEASLVTGGYTANINGESLHYSRENWTPRWAVEGDGSGWMMVIHD